MDLLPPQSVLITRIVVATVFSVLVLVFGKKLWRRLPGFFFEKVSPVNLAMFRIVVFGTLFAYVDPDKLVWVSNLLADLQSIPNSQWSTQLLPAIPPLALAASVCCRLFCIATVFGIATRVSAWAAVITALYVLSFPQSFGHVDHKCSHLIWFAILLASSPCFDVLSIDALRRRKKDPGLVLPEPSWYYGFPIKVAWVLLGVVYFFPGFWKLWRFGIDWALSDQLRLILCKGFIDIYPGLTPLVHIEPFPLICQLGGLIAISFELSFVFLVLFDRLRIFAVLGGLLFHLSTYVFMGIAFWTLPATYPVFVDWSALFKRDWWRAFGIGKHVCVLAEQKVDFVALKQSIREKRSAAMIAVCALLVIVNSALGAVNKEKSWPFACYPSFAFHFYPTYRSIEIDAFDSSGRKISFDFSSQFTRLYPNRLKFLGRVEAISDPQLKQQVIGALWNSCSRTVPALKNAASMKVYTTIIEVNPDRGNHSVTRLEPTIICLSQDQAI